MGSTAFPGFGAGMPFFIFWGRQRKCLHIHFVKCTVSGATWLASFENDVTKANFTRVFLF
jgi:hypothetical protein